MAVIDTRRAGAADAAELMRLRTVMMESLDRGPLPPDGWQDAGVPILQRLLTDPADVLAAFVVDKPGGPGLAACVVGAIDQRLPGPNDPTGLRGYVYNVATDPEHRRRGYSRACLLALIAWFTTNDVTHINLRASPDGLPLYEQLGFVVQPGPSMRLIAG